MHKRTIFLPILIAIVMNGCSSMGIQPWDRDMLAQKKMQVDPYPLDTYLDEHIYYSKESSSGGQGVGGGGCGCN